MAGPSWAYDYPVPFCQQNEWLCTENGVKIDGKYIGHDEPSTLFYSSTPGAGNNAIFELVLPKDPPVLPKQTGTGGTFNFQLHPAFWFGMAMCDPKSFPEFSGSCVPDSDTNIFTSTTPSDPKYIGKHPGTAFMEMQFYPPGWVAWPNGDSCDGKHWCAAINIDSFTYDPNTGTDQNPDCLSKVGREPVNFAFITKSGVSDWPGDPLNSAHFTPNLTNDLLMNPGDRLVVDMHDTANGFQVVIKDLTNHQSGEMTASTANGFANVNFNPVASTCASSPFAFHPMYATSGTTTNVPWSAHTYNVSFADEIGHFEYCSTVGLGGQCIAGGDDLSPLDDFFCFDSTASSRVKIGGCRDTDVDFSGVPYQLVWPGTVPTKDKFLHPQPIQFTSPLLRPDGGGPLANYTNTAFEADMPAIEINCDPSTGTGCTNPPPNANFYPIFSTGTDKKSGACLWQLGGAGIPGATNTFGGTSSAEYGALLALNFPSTSGPFLAYEDYRNILGSNLCNAPPANLAGPKAPLHFGTIKMGSSRTLKVRVSNLSYAPIQISGLVPSTDYSVVADGCTGLLGPFAKCLATVKFAPSLVGADNGMLTFNGDEDNAPFSVSLLGAGK